MRSVYELKILFQHCNNYYYYFKSTGQFFLKLQFLG